MPKSSSFLAHMRPSHPKIYILLVLLVFHHFSSAQYYALNINQATFTLDERTFRGYSTEFTQPYKEVKKEWWRYVNERTIIFNKKTHLILTIPARGKDTNTSLKYVSQLEENKNTKTSILKIALHTEGVPKDQLSALSLQAENLLKDFKVSYFTDIVQDKIEHQEQISKKISLQMDKYLLENSKLQQVLEKKPKQEREISQELNSNTEEIEKLQIKLAKNQKLLSQYKKELTLIK